MTIAAILSGRDGTVIGVQADQKVANAVDVLAQNRIGAVPVLDGEKLIGIFSERDIVRLLSERGPDAVGASLRDVMTREPITTPPATSVMGALSLMTQRRIRHLPVCDGDRLVGFVSIGDLVKYRIDRIEAEAEAMRAYIAT